MPSEGAARILFRRPLHWEYFYDSRGKALIRLYRALRALRARHRALGSRGYLSYYDDPLHRRDGIIAYRRDADAQDASPVESLIVILNFSDEDVDAWISWPKAGTWEEQIDKADNPRAPVQVAHDDQWKPVRVSSNYGGIYLYQ